MDTNLQEILANFARTANVSKYGISHPNDIDRWQSFIIESSLSNNPLDIKTIKEILKNNIVHIRDEKIPIEGITVLIEQYEFSIKLIQKFMLIKGVTIQ